MDNRTILAVLLSLAIWYGWLAMFPPEFPEEPVVAEDGVGGVDDGDGLVDATPADVPAPEPAAVPTGPIEVVEVQICRATLSVTTADGAVRGLTLLDHEEPYDMQPLYSWILGGMDGPWKPYGEPPGLEALLSGSGAGLAASAGPLDRPAPYAQIVRSDASSITTRAVTPDGIEITRTLKASTGEPCAIEAEVSWTNTSASTWTGGLWVGMHDVLPEATSRYAVAMRPKAFVEGDVESRDDLPSLDEREAVEGEVGWFGLADSYFATLVVPGGDAPAGRAVFGTASAPDDQVAHGVHYVLDAPLAAGASVGESFVVYAGPKASGLLGEVDPLLVEAIEMGMLAALAWPLLWLLQVIHGFVGNWGLAIVGLTVLVKAVFFPLTQKSFQSSQAMQAISPMLTEIREKYKDNPEELNKRTMALFQEHGVNPLGGCLPMLVQMPVWFALYSVLLGSVELYHTEFLYMKDLSAIDPYLVSPAIVVVLMVVQQQFMPTGNMDPAQARLMKLMPIIFGFFFFSFPAGLVVYIFVNMVLSILQQWYIRRTFEVPAAPAAQGA